MEASDIQSGGGPRSGRFVTVASRFALFVYTGRFTHPTRVAGTQIADETDRRQTNR